MLDDHKRKALIKLVGDVIVSFDDAVEGRVSIPKLLVMTRLFEAYYEDSDLSMSEAINHPVCSSRSFKRAIDELEEVGAIHIYQDHKDTRVRRIRLDQKFIINMRQTYEPLWQRTVKNLTE